MTPIQVSVPGKIMLAGEYAVLQGASTLSATISGVLEAKIKEAETNTWKISSNLWSDPIYLDSDESSSPLKDCTLIGQKLFQTDKGSLAVTSDLDCTHGVGSSSALRLAVLFAMRGYANKSEEISNEEIGQLAVDLQKESQPNASGYDVATQLIGGLLKLDFAPAQTKSKSWYKNSSSLDDKCFSSLNSLVHVYVGGKGAPTSGTMKRTLDWLKEQDCMNDVIKTSESLVTAFINCFENPDKANKNKLFSAVKNNRTLFEGCPDFPKSIADQLKNLEGSDHQWTFKTTGAGGEDALLLIGESTELKQAETLLKQLGWTPMPYTFSNKKVTIGSPN